jgi:hypothetical protein
MFSKIGKQTPMFARFSTIAVTCPRFLYQSKLEFPWVDHTPFVVLRTLPFALLSAALSRGGASVKHAPLSARRRESLTDAPLCSAL